jgi:hypothetical protein
MRINGHARVSTEPTLLASLVEGGRTPKTAILLTIDEVLFHRGKAINRAKLWEPESRIDRTAVPSIGKMKAAFTNGTDEDAARAEAEYLNAVRTKLY